MRNFDCLRDIELLRDLSLYCEAAEAEYRSKYDVSALNCRRAPEWLVKTLYQLKNIAQKSHKESIEKFQNSFKTVSKKLLPNLQGHDWNF